METLEITLGTFRRWKNFCGVILFCAVTAIASQAKTLTTLAAFNGANGAIPLGLIQGFDGNFYGTTLEGGAQNYGTGFKMTPAGVLTTLHSFCSAGCADGGWPEGRLTQASDGDFYGPTDLGGADGSGVIYRLNSSGMFTVLYNFCSQLKFLVFDDGNFSEYETVLLTDWMAHTPRDVLAANFGVPPQAMQKMVRREKFIFQAAVPGPLADDQKATAGARGLSAQDFAFRKPQMKVAKRTQGGEVTIVDSSTFKVATTIAAAIVTVRPGGIRELHRHPNADEWQYYISGKGRMTVFATGGRARTMDFQAGDVGYVQKTLPHYIQNTGSTDLKFLEMFKSSSYQDLALSEWLRHTPPELVIAHLEIDRATLEAIPKDEVIIMPE